MASWLSFNDLLAVQRLQARGVQLDLERAVLWPHSATQAALAAHVPFSSVAAETIVQYASASRRARPLGFLQLRARGGRPEADVVFISPALDSGGDIVSIWYRLLAECAKEIGGRGGQRLFAQVTSGNGVEEVFRQAGFIAYAHDDVFRLDALPANLPKTAPLRHQRVRDGWDLLRLYAEFAPRSVQIAEGMLSPQGQGGKLGDWWDQSGGAGYILPVDGDIAGAVRVRRSSAAYWLRFWLHPQAEEYGETLILGAFALLRAAPPRPIYCNVREYESGLRGALDLLGFRNLQTRSLLIKHTTARVKEPRLTLMPALEKRPEPAHSATQHNSPV
ncbi:MAG: hypothetical protein HY868_27360 [Chloroflexi bacterium]|nr:hypothetical protein [Chloroflexota bacterium]